MRDWKKDKEICEAVPPGPWSDVTIGHETQMALDREIPPHVVRHWLDEAGRRCTSFIAECCVTAASPEDAPKVAAFIAAAREGWPAALEEIERLQEVLRTIGFPGKKISYCRDGHEEAILKARAALKEADDG